MPETGPEGRRTRRPNAALDTCFGSYNTAAGDDGDTPAIEMTSNDPVDPGVGFQAAVGIYVGAIGTGLASIALAVAEVSIGALLSTVPSVFTAGLVVGALAAWAQPGVAERLGARRWRIVELLLPAIAIGGSTAALFSLEAVSSAAALIPAGVATLGIALSGWGTAAIARDAYVEAITDEPAVSWPWLRADPDVTALGIGIGFLAVGAGLAPVTDGRSLVLFVVAAPFVGQSIGPALSSDGSEQSDEAIRVSIFSYVSDSPAFTVDQADLPRHELRAYDAGLVIEPAMKPSHRRLVPWDRITDVRLTDQKLVLERRLWPAIQCDRAAIDDPEAIATTVRTYVASKATAKRTASDRPAG